MNNQRPTFTDKGVFYRQKDGTMRQATPEPYHPSIIEHILHYFGKHIWTYNKPYRCVYPGCEEHLQKHNLK